MKKEDYTASIMFADIVGYSKISDDAAKEKFRAQFNKIREYIFNEGNHFYSNTWGDAIFVCANNPVDLAEAALKLRDEIKNTNWKRMGIADSMAIRIGLHIQRISCYYNGDKVKEVVGKGIDKTARIEPIVAPNHIYCSARFYEHLADEENSGIAGVSIGKKMLAKNYGESDLYDLYREGELQNTVIHDNSQVNIPLPKIKRDFSDKDRSEFIRNTFIQIFNFFETACNELKKSDDRINYDIQKTSNSRFITNIFVDGTSRAKCKIWIMEDDFRNGQIVYRGKRLDFIDDNSFNDYIMIEDDSFKQFWKASGLQFGMRSEYYNRELTPEEAAAYFWTGLIKQLEN